MDNQNIVDKFASILSSDVLSAYSDLQAVLAERNIVPGSFRYSQNQCTDMQRDQLNSSNGQLFTRLRLGPVVNCTHPSTNQIRWEFTIPANSMGIQLMNSFDAGGNRRNDLFGYTNGDPLPNLNAIDIGNTPEKLRIWIGYCNAAQIASEVAITYQGSVPGWDSGLFNEEHTMLAQHSLSNAIHENSAVLTSLDALFEKSSPGCGTIIEVPFSTLRGVADPTYVIPTPITISGIIDLNQLNPIFNHFPIMTPAFSNVWIRLRMNNFLRSLQKVVLNKMNPVTGEYLPIQYTPPEKPDVIIVPRVPAANILGKGAPAVITDMVVPGAGDDADTNYVATQINVLAGKIKANNSITIAGAMAPYENMLCRLVNVNGINVGIPSNSIANLPNVAFNIMETRQLTYQLEDQIQVDNMFRSKGFFLQPTRFFRSIKFNNRNEGSSGNQLQVVTGIPNISKFFVTFNYRPEYPLYCPFPMLREINPLWRNAPVLSSHDDSIDKNAAYRIFNCFVDVDLVSPPTSLFDSIVFKNNGVTRNTPYGNINIFDAPNGLFNRGAATPSYIPNQFVYAFDASGGCYLRGYNVVGKDYDGTSQFEMQITDGQAAANANNPTATANTQNQTTWQDFIRTSHFGAFSHSPGTSSLHCLCDGILRFQFGPDGNVSEIRCDGSI